MCGNIGIEWYNVTEEVAILCKVTYHEWGHDKCRVSYEKQCEGIKRPCFNVMLILVQGNIRCEGCWLHAYGNEC